MFSLHNTSGFYCATVSKLLIFCLIGGCILINIFFSATKSWLQIDYKFVYDQFLFGKLFLLRCFFLDTIDLFFAIILIYNFRLFERRYGSAKFVSFLIFTFILSFILEIVVFYFFVKCGFEQKVPSGLWGPIFAFYVPYFLDIPKVISLFFCGVPISGKSITYLIGLQMICGSSVYIILAFIAIISGAIYQSSVPIQTSFLVPHRIRKICNKSIGFFLGSERPKELSKPMGATIELQKIQRVEQMENRYRILQHYT